VEEARFGGDRGCSTGAASSTAAGGAIEAQEGAHCRAHPSPSEGCLQRAAGVAK
jgi:hypothetical protein